MRFTRSFFGALAVTDCVLDPSIRLFWILKTFNWINCVCCTSFDRLSSISYLVFFTRNALLLGVRLSPRLGALSLGAPSARRLIFAALLWWAESFCYYEFFVNYEMEWGTIGCWWWQPGPLRRPNDLQIIAWPSVILFDSNQLNIRLSIFFLLLVCFQFPPRRGPPQLFPTVSLSLSLSDARASRRSADLHSPSKLNEIGRELMTVVHADYAV